MCERNTQAKWAIVRSLSLMGDVYGSLLTELMEFAGVNNTAELTEHQCCAYLINKWKGVWNMKLKIATESDRLAVAAVLVKNEYTVRQGKERREGKSAYDYFLYCAPESSAKSRMEATSEGSDAV